MTEQNVAGENAGVREKPILFSGPMVRAILEGRKRQTRRVLKPQPEKMPAGTWHVPWQVGGGSIMGADATDHCIAVEMEQGLRTEVGDRLWVREAWARSDDHEWLVAYRADGTCGAWMWDGDGKPAFNRHGLVLDPARRDDKGEWGLGKFGGKWRPSIHLPRKYSRITLEVADVKVERLQDISHEDAVAEGMGIFPHSMSAQKRFREVWESINGPGSWEANPWVVVISFKRLTP